MHWRSEIDIEGFAVLGDVLSADEIDSLLCDIHTASPKRSRAGIRHALHLDPVAVLARKPQLMEIVQPVLGRNAFPFRATLFDKSEKQNWLVVWHQDTALPLRSRKDLTGWGPWSVKEGIDYAHAPASVLAQVLALRVGLDESTSENGPLRALPRTHQLGVLDDNRIHELSLATPQVECICAKGAIVAMKPLLVHSSSKSRANISRRVLHIEYAASDSIALPFQLAIA